MHHHSIVILQPSFTIYKTFIESLSKENMNILHTIFNDRIWRGFHSVFMEQPRHKALKYFALVERVVRVE